MLSNLLFTYVTLLVLPVNTLNILVLPMHMAASHKKSLLPLSERLASHGHNVTMWNSFLVPQPVKSSLIHQTDLVVSTTDPDYLDQFIHGNGTSLMDPWAHTNLNVDLFYKVWVPSIEVCRLTMEQHADKVLALINASPKWDLIVLDALFSACGYLITNLMHVLHDVPFVYTSTTFQFTTNQRHRSIPEPIADAFHIDRYYDPLSTYDRFRHVLSWQFGDRAMEYYIQSSINGILRDSQRFRQLASRSGIDLSRDEFQFSMSFVDQTALLSMFMFPTVMDGARPAVFDQVRAADMNCPVAHLTPLGVQYAKFVEDASSKGTILVAFGHLVNWNTVPASVIYTLLEGFRRVEGYKIVWQYNGPELKLRKNNSYNHILVDPWLPQPQLLSHTKTVLFLSHMGLKSVKDTFCARLPVVALPIFSEQGLNTRILIDRLKIGVSLSKDSLSPKRISEAIQKVINEPLYKNNVERLAGRMNDIMRARPTVRKPIEGSAGHPGKLSVDKKPDSDASTLDNAVFWIEWVVKHRRNIDLLALKGRRLNMVKYFSMDVIVAWTSVAIVITFSIVKVVMKLMK